MGCALNRYQSQQCLFHSYPTTNISPCPANTSPFPFPCLPQAKRTAACVAISHCDLCVLNSHDLKAVLKDFPEEARKLKVWNDGMQGRSVGKRSYQRYQRNICIARELKEELSLGALWYSPQSPATGAL